MFSEIEPFLRQLQKPGRYLGGEWNIIKKDFNNIDVKILLCFPDLYEIGMSNLGLQILYGIINKLSYALAERVYAPGMDMEELLRHRNMPLFSLESQRPVASFDILGFSLQSELSYTNVLNIMNLSGIPVLSRDRNESHPLVIAGGPATINPEPMADFIDVFVLGDGEETVVKIIELYKQEMKNNDKRELLERISSIEGVYVPSFYEVTYYENGKISGFYPKSSRYKLKIHPSHVDIEKAYFPVSPIVPSINTVHDRLNVEIARGCPGSCRFCQARVYYSPYRVRSRQNIMNIIDTALKNTGYEEIALSSLSAIVHKELENILYSIYESYAKNKISVSLPSLRPGLFSKNIAALLGSVKKTGLTFALEGGSRRMRKRIGKDISDEEILDSIESAYKSSWKKIKLYFMYGLPLEEDIDIEDIIKLCKKIKHLFKDIKLNISLNPFVPKPQTPFQWVAFGSIKELKRKHLRLAESLGRKINSHDIKGSFLEAVFARGDRRLSGVISKAWSMGARFDQWPDMMRYNIWEDAFKGEGVDPLFYTRGFSRDDILPWEHIEWSDTKESLWEEYQKAIGLG